MGETVVRLLLVSVVAGLCFRPLSAQPTMVVGEVVDAERIPSLIHVKRVTYPGLQLAVWEGEILVDSAGRFDWSVGPLEAPTLFELVAPPWSWMVLIRPNESAQLRLAPAQRVPQRLLGSPGRSTWIGEHPTHRLDSLMSTVSRSNDLRAESLVLRTSGVGLVGRDSLTALSETLEATFMDQWNAALALSDSETERHILWHIRLIEAANAGTSRVRLDSLWKLSNFAPLEQDWEALLTSLGGFASWQLVHGTWWEDSDVNWLKMSEALFLANRDSMAAAMGPTWEHADAAELGAAWLHKALIAPDAFTKSVWETIPFPRPFFVAYEALTLDRQRGRAGGLVGDLPWTLPNGELGSIREQCRQPWVVILAVKNGSSIARREREVYNQVAESMNRRDVCWVVLSLDENEDDWRETLSARRTLEETIGWVGNSPQVMEQLGLTVIPQVILLNEDNTIVRGEMPLPGMGLQQVLERTLPKL